MTKKNGNGLTKAERTRDAKEAKAIAIRLLWAKACEFDGIDKAATFVVFSKDNPWAVKLNRWTK